MAEWVWWLIWLNVWAGLVMIGYVVGYCFGYGRAVRDWRNGELEHYAWMKKKEGE